MLIFAIVNHFLTLECNYFILVKVKNENITPTPMKLKARVYIYLLNCHHILEKYTSYGKNEMKVNTSWWNYITIVREEISNIQITLRRIRRIINKYLTLRYFGIVVMATIIKIWFLIPKISFYLPYINTYLSRKRFALNMAISLILNYYHIYIFCP